MSSKGIRKQQQAGTQAQKETMRRNSIFSGLHNLSLLLALAMCVNVEAHQLGSRWAVTATDGSGLVQGDPTTITWGFVPDGTQLAGSGTSDLIGALDFFFEETDTGPDLTQRTWWQHFDASFDRWSQLSGLSYTYEPNDDGSIAGLINAGIQLTPGFLGVRADVRIGGTFIDGPPRPGERNTLGRNFFPEFSGEMILDSADGMFFAESLGNFVGFRNLIMHEHGHGLGIRHVESDEGAFLMEPLIDLSFDGPQFDDILAAHRGYGDVYEKKDNGAGQAEGNEIFQHSIPLGQVPNGGIVEIGTNARPDVSGLPLRVEPEDVDFVSIDGISDIDFFSFEVPADAVVDVAINPLGPTYLESEQNGTQTPYDTSSFNNLSVQLFDVDGTTQLASNNGAGIGDSEFLNAVEVGPGTYYIRVEGELDDVQFYDVIVAAEYEEIVANGDFNSDGAYDCADVNALVAEIASGSGDVSFDITGDGIVDSDDLDQWLVEGGAANGFGGAFIVGDANLDGVVDLSDFNIWNGARLSNTAAWCSGDFNADGAVDVSDFNLWNGNRFQSSDALQSVPEPSGFGFALFGMVAIGWLRRK